MESGDRAPGRRPGGEAPEAESLLAFGRPKKATKFVELTISGKCYLLHLTALYLRENEGCTKTTDEGEISLKQDC